MTFEPLVRQGHGFGRPVVWGVRGRDYIVGGPRDTAITAARDRLALLVRSVPVVHELPSCSTCHDSGEVTFNLSRVGDPQCVDSAPCPDCKVAGLCDLEPSSPDA